MTAPSSLGSPPPRVEYFISDWATTEFAGALAIKARQGDIDDGQLAQAWLAFDAACGTLLEVERVEAEEFGLAAAWCLQPPTGLRSGDSLHLAAASRVACKSVVSFDDTLNPKARASGLAVIAP
jgi:uncharacterized protein